MITGPSIYLDQSRTPLPTGADSPAQPGIAEGYTARSDGQVRAYPELLRGSNRQDILTVR